MDSNISIKFRLAGKSLRRANIESPLTLLKVKDKLLNSFPELQSGQFTIKYQDGQGDEIEVERDEDLMEAMTVFIGRVLSFTICPKPTYSTYDESDPMNSFDPMNEAHGLSSGPTPSEIQQLMNGLGMAPENNVGAQVRGREHDSISSTTAIPKRPCDKSGLSHTFIYSDGGVSGFSGHNEWIPNGDTVDIFCANNSFTTSSATNNPSLSHQHNAAVGPEYMFSSDNSFTTHSVTENPSESSYQHSMDSSRHAAAAQNDHQPVATLPRHAAAPQVEKVLQCGFCKAHTKHSIHRLSVHCRVGKNIKEVYESITCLECKTESSPCPNHGKFAHPKGNLRWFQNGSTHTDEKVWQLECPTCLDERARRKGDESYAGHKKITVKWTRCNHCKALYKKGKGKKGLHSSDKCRVLAESHGDSKLSSPAGKHSPRNSPRTHSHALAASPHAEPSASSSEHIEYVKRLLAMNAFEKFPPDLQKRIVEQCQCHV